MNHDRHVNIFALEGVTSLTLFHSPRATLQTVPDELIENENLDKPNVLTEVHTYECMKSIYVNLNLHLNYSVCTD
ncbi:hypothetical protein DPMN_130731 [Dreissena polymorpha]|uniref:Uncharacterized protein n=1 Tax=Dreissena polymorpha TaxID=45954 RepID=A0A9D4H782_DREPO|nr:hypothetical protein DPMN_130731 [Dreissena polymorpha]